MRPQKCRFIKNAPPSRFYKPQGIPLRDLEIVQLKDEELEAIILCDHQNKNQQDAAALMKISRPTFSRILTHAHSSIAQALAEGKALQIGGGNYRRAPHTKIKMEKNMKILITSSGPDLGANIDPRFGRADYFLIYDTESQAITTIDNNEQKNAAHGAGIQSANTALKAGVNIVITGRCGPKAFRVLKEAGVKLFISEKTTGSQALEMFLAGSLSEMQSEN